MKVVALALLSLIVHVTSAWPHPAVAHATMRLSASRGGSTIPLSRTKRFITTSLSDQRGKRLIYPESRDPIPIGSSSGIPVQPGLEEKASGGSAEAMINSLLRGHTGGGPAHLHEVPAKAVSEEGSLEAAMISNLLQDTRGGRANLPSDEVPAKDVFKEGSVEAMISKLLRGIPERGTGLSASDDVLASDLRHERGDRDAAPVKRFIGLEPGHSANLEEASQDAPRQPDQPESAAGLISRLMSGRRDPVIHQPKQVASPQGDPGMTSASAHTDDALDIATLENLLEKILTFKLAKNAANLDFQ